MLKHSERLREIAQRRAAQVRERNRRWIEHGAHLSQMLLLALGVFGYFYTVLPVYEKALLDEEIAQKTLELREQQKQSADLSRRISEQERQVQAREREVAVARSAESAARAEARETYERLRIQYIGVAAHGLRRCAAAAAKDGIKGDELERCPATLLEDERYNLNDLRPKDVALFDRMLRAKVLSLQPPFRIIVQQYESRVIAHKAKIAELEKKAEDEKAKPGGGLRAALDLMFARDDISSIKRDAYFALSKILEDAGDALFREYLDRVSG